MEIRIGNQRICGATIDNFCSYTGKDPGQELTEPQKIDITNERVNKLNRTEWQRWAPFLGFYRVLKDCVTRDNLLLNEMRSTAYNVANIAYNVSTTIAGSGLLLNVLLK